MNWKVFLIAAGIAVILSALFFGPWSVVSREEIIARILLSVITACAGIAIGASEFRLLAGSGVRGVRVASALASGVLAFVIGGWASLFITRSVYQTLPSACLAGLVGCIFGAGLGQSARRQ